MRNGNDCADIKKMIFIYKAPFIYAVSQELKKRRGLTINTDKEPDENELTVSMCWEVSFGSGLITNIDTGDAFCEFLFIGVDTGKFDDRIIKDEKYMLEKMTTCIQKRMDTLDDLLKGSIHGDLHKRFDASDSCKKILIIEKD